jgi:hypothetical protein
MSVLSVLLPVLVQIGLIFGLLFWLASARYRAVKAGAADVATYRDNGGGFPRGATLINNCYKHQFELPVLFFALVPLAMLTQKADFFFVVLAWLFVVSRLIHAAVYTTTNDITRRSLAFVFGAIVLCVMWLKFGFDIMTATL